MVSEVEKPRKGETKYLSLCLELVVIITVQKQDQAVFSPTYASLTQAYFHPHMSRLSQPTPKDPVLLLSPLLSMA